MANLPAPPESAPSHQRSYFYVGGRYSDDGTGKGEHIFQDQMYVEQLTPVAAANWLNTPDGREGWASWLTRHGYAVYIIDFTARGRSGTAGYAPTTPQQQLSAESVQRFFTATGEYGLWPEASLHTQWPGTGKMGDPTFDAYYASTTPVFHPTVTQQHTMQAAGAALFDRIGAAILITHSRGAPMGWLWADARPDLVKGIVALEPLGPPFCDRILRTGATRKYGLTDIPLTFDRPVDDDASSSDKPLGHAFEADFYEICRGRKKPVEDEKKPAIILVNLRHVPILVVTGQSSYHVVYDRDTVAFLRYVGVEDVTHLELAREGILGNGHLFFMEKNNLEILSTLERWIGAIGRLSGK
ncbi:MAG: hypothetical protein M1819_003025 [Sarea resinae]|nr:MAG: hypothetical protein M1819_003025 [Sarea resinae]